MATVVAHRSTGHRYILVGAGFGMYKSSRPGILFGNLDPQEQSGSASLLAVCDGAGQIGWIASHELVVVSVDGRAPGEHL